MKKFPSRKSRFPQNLFKFLHYVKMRHQLRQILVLCIIVGSVFIIQQQIVTSHPTKSVTNDERKVGQTSAPIAPSTINTPVPIIPESPPALPVINSAEGLANSIMCSNIKRIGSSTFWFTD
jgi:hypothetical protein